MSHTFYRAVLFVTEAPDGKTFKATVAGSPWRGLVSIPIAAVPEGLREAIKPDAALIAMVTLCAPESEFEAREIEIAPEPTEVVREMFA